MKRYLPWVCLVLLAGLVQFAAAQNFSDPPPPVNTVRLSPDLAEIAKLVQARAPEDQIRAHIKAHPRLYSVTADDVKNLKRVGVSGSYVSAMRAHDKALLKVWKRAGGEVAGSFEDDSSKVLPPKMKGGNPATDLGAPMRQDAPLILLRAPLASTNAHPSKYVRQWTSTVIVEQAPPPPQLEVAPQSPGPDYVWVRGNWMWRGGNWVWDSGRWLRRPAPTANWMNGEWQPHARGWIWVPGQWQ